MSNTEFRKKLVLNGKFYTGQGNDLSDNKSEAVAIESQAELNAILVGVLGSVMDGVIELKRIEVLRA